MHRRGLLSDLIDGVSPSTGLEQELPLLLSSEKAAGLSVRGWHPSFHRTRDFRPCVHSVVCLQDAAALASSGNIICCVFAR